MNNAMCKFKTWRHFAKPGVIAVGIGMAGVVFVDATSVCADFDVAYSQRYDAWARQNPFPVSALHTATNPVPSLTTEQIIQRYRDSGMTQFTGLGPVNSYDNLAEAERVGYAWQADVKNYDDMNAFQTEVNLAMSIGDGPTAMRIYDEPGEVDIPVIKERVQWMRSAGVQQGFNETGVASPLIYANLSLFDVDIDNYIEQVDPDVLSYTWYPLYRDGTTDNHHFEFMKIARTASLEHNVPLWMFQQTYGRSDPESGALYRLPSESDMRFQAFTFLGQGGLGIRYFLYLTEGNPEAIIDGTTNQPTAVYGHIQNVTPEVENMGRSLPLLRPVDEVAFLGQALIDFDDTPLFTGRGDLQNITGGTSLQVSFFEDGLGEEYFMVVNLLHGDGLSADDLQDTIRLWFDSDVLMVERLNRLTGEIDYLETIFASSQRYLDVTLPGGTGDLFKYHTDESFAMIPEPMTLVMAMPVMVMMGSRRYRSTEKLRSVGR